MKNVAFIPVRGGSKSIPLKNIKSFCGRPLVYWTLKAACGCKAIDKVYVATDSDEIRNVVEKFKYGTELDLFQKVEIIGRSQENASDNASTESAMLEFAEKYDFNCIALVQATSPLLCSEDLERGFQEFEKEGTDSVLSVVEQKRFNWEKGLAGYVKPINYDIYKRPRRQEFDGYFVENGAFYITSKFNLLKTGNRLSGNIRAVEMSESTFFEVDEPSDWTIMETLMKIRDNNKGNMKEIKMFLTDVDGCLTDGGMYYSENGDELKKFNTRDGMGFSLLKKRGILTGIVTSESVGLNKRRAEKLKLDIVKQGCKDKLSIIKDICREYNIEMNNVCYIGDDINDFEVIREVGYGCCPSDAIEEIKSIADYVAGRKGGEGVIREVVDELLYLRD